MSLPTPSFGATLRMLPRTLWIANLMEIFERMAWYGFYAVAPLYITGKVSDGALGFSAQESGVILGIVTFLLYLMPVVTGALGDRYGYKKMFIIAYSILTPGYYLLGEFTSMGGFFAVFLLVALGAAVFKPVVVGTVARCTTAQTASVGFGLFYMMVNIGGFVGPIVAGIVRAESWRYVFLASAIWIGINFFWVTLFYKEPTSEAGSANRRTVKQVFADIVRVLGNGRFFLTVFSVLFIFMMAGKRWIAWWPDAIVFTLAWVGLNVVYDIVIRANKWSGGSWLTQPMRVGDWRFGLYLLVLSGFWTLFNQIFMTMPLYIQDFVDTTSIFRAAASMADSVGWASAQGYFEGLIRDGYIINPEYIVNLDALSIVLLQIFISWFVGRFRAFPTMIVGNLIVTIGMTIPALAGAGTGVSAGWPLLGIFVFAVGEMVASPKSQEYVGRIAPDDKKALYMGYYFVTIALGNLFGGLISGEFYSRLAQEAGRPDWMWLAIGGVGLLTTAALIAYDKFALRGRDQTSVQH